MWLTAKAFVICFVLIVAFHHPIVIAYEQTPPLSPPVVQSNYQRQSNTSLWGAIKEATFADYLVNYLDHTAVFLKDFLDQVGLRVKDN